jgi:hypothetical protein
MEIKKNKSTVFLLPLLKDRIPFAYVADCVNSYVFNSFLPEDNVNLDKLYIAFELKDLEKNYYMIPGNNRTSCNKERFELLEKSSFLDKKVIYDDFILFSFYLNDEFSNDVANFIEGKYSKFSETAKIKIALSYNSSKVQNILNPTDKVKKEFASKLGLDSIAYINEILDKPNKEVETFKLSHFLKIVQ